MRECLVEHAGDILLALHDEAAAAEGSGQHVEIRRGEVGGDRTVGIEPLLADADGAEAPVVREDDDDGKLALDRDRQLVAGHQKAAIADEADHLPPRMAQRDGDGTRNAEAHDPCHRAEELLRRAKGEVAVDQRRRDAGIRHDDDVGRQPRREIGDHIAEDDAVGAVLGLPLADAGTNGREPPRPGLPRFTARRHPPFGQRLQKGRRIGDGPDLGLEPGADHLGIVIDMDQPLPRPGNSGKV
jgi:hypothetical protein